mgnify:CR=1 FL=1
MTALPPDITPDALASLPREDREQALALLGERRRREGQRLFHRLFPEEGPRARHLYPRHLEFFRAGAEYRERCFMAANRVGKTVSGGFECACHLTGLYPAWWEGKRFDRPVSGWAAGKTNETTRDIVQRKLLGRTVKGTVKSLDGTGIVPGERLGDVTWKQGVPDLVDTVAVRHVSGEWSTLGLKSYQQGRGSFEGTEQDFIWLDEEPPMDVYGECLIRTATTGGIVMITFTPLEGLSEVVMQFLPGDMRAGEG